MGCGQWLVVLRQIAIRVRTPQFVVPLLAVEETRHSMMNIVVFKCVKSLSCLTSLTDFLFLIHM